MKFAALYRFALERGYTVHKIKACVEWTRNLDHTKGKCETMQEAHDEIHHDYEARRNGLLQV
jgi:hypothetical protein